MVEHEDAMRHLLMRLFPIIVLVIIGSIGHKILTSYHQHAIGSILFILVIIAGMFTYYQKLFHEKSISNIEFIISMMFIFITIISMFAMIYSSASFNEKDGFMYLGNKVDLAFTDALYYSTITITTLGYGDIVPLGVYRFYAMTEVVIGWIFLGIIVFYITQIMQRETDLIKQTEKELMEKISILDRLKLKIIDPNEEKDQKIKRPKIKTKLD